MRVAGLIAPPPTVTVDAFTTALRNNPDDAIEMAHLDGGASLAPGQANRAVTLNLRPSSTYVAINLAGENPAGWCARALL